MSALSHEQAMLLLRFNHPEKKYPNLSEQTTATVLDIPLETYRQVKAECAAVTRQAAQELLADASFAARVARLPFAPGDTVVGLGDSITDDWQSWLEILRALLALQRPADRIRVVNAGVSGETTAQMFFRAFYTVAAEKPDWIICMAGTNDARKYGDEPLKVEVSPEETEKNLAQLRAFGATRTTARWVWMTPAPVFPDIIRQHGPVEQLIWASEDIARVAEIVRRQKDPVVDLQQAFGAPPDSAYFFDGLHPTVAGQQRIVRALVERLTD